MTEELKKQLKELAVDIFLKLKEEALDEDIHCLGAEQFSSRRVDGSIYTIWVGGFWEKATWMDYRVMDESGNVLHLGSWCQ